MDAEGLKLQKELTMAIDKVYHHYGESGDFVVALVDLRVRYIEHFKLKWNGEKYAKEDGDSTT